MPTKAIRPLLVLVVLGVLAAAGSGCWDGEHTLRRHGAMPYKPDTIWSFSLTRNTGTGMVESGAMHVPGMDVVCVFGLMGCALLDLIVLPVALLHDIWVLATGRVRIPDPFRARGTDMEEAEDADWHRTARPGRVP